MFSRNLILSIIFGMLASLSVHSQTVTNDAPALGPVIRAYYEALKKRDDAGVIRVLGSGSLAVIKKDMKGSGVKSIAAFLAQTDYRKDMPPIQVKDEIIVKDKGVAEVKGSYYKTWTLIGFVKENGTWRITFENAGEWKLAPATMEPAAAQTMTINCIAPNQVFDNSRSTGELNAENLRVRAERADSDCDGISNFRDNCPYTYNPDQKDRDKNGIGNVCEEKKRKVKHN